jgi:thiol-disulfide isomerase/thioredoxin
MMARSLMRGGALALLWFVPAGAVPAADPGQPSPQLPPFALESPREVHPAPDFSLPDSAGRHLVLRELRPRIVIVNFWATWCGPCVAELPELKALAESLREEPFALLTVDVMESVPRVQDFLRGAGFQLSTLFDEKGFVYRDYGVNELPTTFVVDGQGRLIARAVGARAWHSPESIAYFRRLLAAQAHR